MSKCIRSLWSYHIPLFSWLWVNKLWLNILLVLIFITFPLIKYTVLWTDHITVSFPQEYVFIICLFFLYKRFLYKRLWNISYHITWKRTWDFLKMSLNISISIAHSDYEVKLEGNGLCFPFGFCRKENYAKLMSLLF